MNYSPSTRGTQVTQVTLEVEASGCLTFPHPLSPDHCALDRDANDVGRVFFEYVATKDDEVSQLARCDRAFQILFVRGTGTNEGTQLNGFFQRDLLLWPP